jgi:hypothetical protein
VADDGYPDAFQIFFFGKHPPDQRLYAQNAPEIGCRFASGDLLGFGIARKSRSPRLCGRNVRENRIVAPPLQPFRRRRHKARAILTAHVKPNHDETVRVIIRQRTNQYRVEGAEHRRNPAYAERQCCDCGG